MPAHGLGLFIDHRPATLPVSGDGFGNRIVQAAVEDPEFVEVVDSDLNKQAFLKTAVEVVAP